MFRRFQKMRWVSWDQKPAWFNNTALDATYSTIGYEPLVKEIEAHSRQRFTVCTCVDSATTGNPDKPPPVGVLFKAAPRGIVWAELTARPLIPAWMHVHTQIKGSYRASDMVELLEKTLKPAGEDYESQVICLDCYAPHMDIVSLAELIESRGHVPLIYGGGMTAYEQAADTHMHQRFKEIVSATE